MPKRTSAFRDGRQSRPGGGRLWCCLLLLGLVLPGCENQPEGCGGNQSAAACLSLASIVPGDEPSGATSNVDAVQDICTAEPGSPLEFEAFTDHYADLTLRNVLAPGIAQGLAVTLQSFTLTYSLSRCSPLALTCPQLSGFSAPVGQSVTILPNSSATLRLPFVPLAVKNEYVRGGGEVGRLSTSYTATYTLNLRTQFTDDTITLSGSAEFSLTNFDACETD
ncbi:MAG: hypothetical protein AB7N91_04050 [Candidatus Tectimicrobiota bacterium]